MNYKRILGLGQLRIHCNSLLHDVLRGCHIFQSFWRLSAYENFHSRNRLMFSLPSRMGCRFSLGYLANPVTRCGKTVPSLSQEKYLNFSRSERICSVVLLWLPFILDILSTLTDLPVYKQWIGSATQKSRVFWLCFTIFFKHFKLRNCPESC